MANPPPPSYYEATTHMHFDPSSTNKSRSNTLMKFGKEKEELETCIANTAPPDASDISPLIFDVYARRPIFEASTTSIVPVHPCPDLSLWQLRYSDKYHAVVSRHAPAPQQHHPTREIASVEFPKTLEPIRCGPIIKFQPHEAEIERRGRHATHTDRFMHCHGIVTTVYSIELPAALGHARVEWKVLQGGSTETSLPSASLKTRAYGSSSKAGAGAEKSWSPFPIQHLIEEGTRDIWATFSREAPWSAKTGVLTIPHDAKRHSAETIEAIVITCAAMVGMQDRAYANILVEAVFDNLSITFHNQKHRLCGLKAGNAGTSDHANVSSTLTAAKH